MGEKYRLIAAKNKLWRVQALKNFADVKAGDLGGFVGSEENLSQEDNCWIYDEAVVCENARLIGNATVSGCAMVLGNAIIADNACVNGSAVISDNARIYKGAYVSGAAQVCGNAIITDNACVSGHATICDYAYVRGRAEVTNNTLLCGAVIVEDSAIISHDGGPISDIQITGCSWDNTEDYFVSVSLPLAVGTHLCYAEFHDNGELEFRELVVAGYEIIGNTLSDIEIQLNNLNDSPYYTTTLSELNDGAASRLFFSKEDAEIYFEDHEIKKYDCQVSFCEGQVIGVFSFSAESAELAQEKALVYFGEKLAWAFPGLDIPVTVNVLNPDEKEV